MAEVEFHTGVTDTVGFACRLLRKAHRQGLRVLVTAPPALLADLDTRLWTFDDQDFIPHVRMPGATADVAARTPVWLALDPALDGAPRVWLNLGAYGAPMPRQREASTVDPGRSLAHAAVAVDRMIEVVSADAEEIDRGRARWRDYKQLGWQVRHHPSPTAATDG